jgi:Reverse transcriptase (RNA-dependent DNA polymerase)
MLEYITKDEESDIQWKFRPIVSHECKGSQCNLLIECEGGEITSEPLTIVAADDPVSWLQMTQCPVLSMRMKMTSLINLVGKGLSTLLSEKRRSLIWSIRLNSDHTTRRLAPNTDLKFLGHLCLDKRNRNTLWGDAKVLELTQIDDYVTFIDKGHHTKVKSPIGYNKIRVHLTYDVKHDCRHKARLVADGHLTDIPLESVYSGVVSLRGFRIVLFLDKLNHLKLWSTDIGNAYLEASTSEKVYIIADPEFWECEGHILIISKALYGLRSSSARWHDRFVDCI